MLKVLMLRKKINAKQDELKVLRSKDAEIEKRGQELETAVEEAKTEEEIALLEESIAEFDKEKSEHESAKSELEKEIKDMEDELKAAETEQTEAAERAAKAAGQVRVKEREGEKRMLKGNMELRELILNDEVRTFLGNVRTVIREKRAVTGSDLTIPEVMLPLLRENIKKFSKLTKHVNMKHISGKARELVLGTAPEAKWLEMYSNKELTELDFEIKKLIELDGYMVAGLMTISNAMLEDSDMNLSAEILDMLGQSIGFALDKAILYGQGSTSKQPEGIMKGMAADNKFAIPTNKSGIDLFKELLKASAKLDRTYAVDHKFWVMNNTTFTNLQIEAMGINAAGAIVTGMNNTMPIIGGEIEIIDFIPDHVIIGGYGSMYLLAERAGTKLDKSEHIKFTSDQTVFKGTARYDGKLVINKSFIALGLNNKKPTDDGTPAV